MKLKNKRAQIDEIDKKIAILLNERFLIIEEIKKIKEEENLLVEDKNRESEVIVNNGKYIETKYHNYYKKIYEVIFSSSKDIQQHE